MSIGAVVTRGFSTGAGFQPGVKFIPTRGFLAGEAAEPDPTTPTNLSATPANAVYGADRLQAYKIKKAKEENLIMKYIEQFMRDL